VPLLGHGVTVLGAPIMHACICIIEACICCCCCCIEAIIIMLVGIIIGMHIIIIGMGTIITGWEVPGAAEALSSFCLFIAATSSACSHLLLSSRIRANTTADGLRTSSKPPLFITAFWIFELCSRKCLAAVSSILNFSMKSSTSGDEAGLLAGAEDDEEEADG